MTDWALHARPRPGGVLREQVRAAGLALRWPAAVAAALVALATLVVGADILRHGQVVGFHPERWVLPGLAGLLLPVWVWVGEERFGTGFLWTLPVDRRGHALARVFAGWVWLTAAVALFVLWMLGLALLSGGGILAEETLHVIPAFPLPGPGPIDPGTLRSVRWRPEPVLWLAPFTAATAMYLLGSAVALGLRHPLRWIAGSALGLGLVLLAAEAGNVDAAAAPSRLVEALVAGRYGLETLLVAGTEALKVETTLPGGEPVVVWRGLPNPAQWAIATLLWTVAGLAALWAAASRHRETRRA